MPLLSLRTVNTETHSYDTSTDVSDILLDKVRQNSGRCLQVCTICNKNQQDTHRYKMHPVRD